MKYQNIVKGIFLARPNRFIAEVLIGGVKCSAHVRNTGRCRELLISGSTVYLEDHAGHMGSRKLRYSLIAAEKKTPGGILLVNLDSQAPNRIACEVLESGLVRLSGMDGLSLLQSETVYGDSRFDFYAEDISGKKGFLEVKGCTLEHDGIASFPDAPTLRGVKHIEGLIRARQEGYSAGILFVIQMEGMQYIRPNDETHPEFGAALRKAEASGVDILALECHVEEDSLTAVRQIPVRL